MKVLYHIFFESGSLIKSAGWYNKLENGTKTQKVLWKYGLLAKNHGTFFPPTKTNGKVSNLVTKIGLRNSFKSWANCLWQILCGFWPLQNCGVVGIVVPWAFDSCVKGFHFTMGKMFLKSGRFYDFDFFVFINTLNWKLFLELKKQLESWIH